jgi:hypothetical protein
MWQLVISLVLVAALASPVLAAPFDDVVNDNLNLSEEGKGVATDNTSENYQSRASDGSASASNGADAYVDNSVHLSDSALSRTQLDGTISGNATHMDNSHYDGVNEIDEGAFREVRGVSQVSQNSGQNSLIQQSFTVQGNVKADHRRP